MNKTDVRLFWSIEKNVKRLLSVILAAILTCGFALPETPAQRKAREKEEHAWAKVVFERYDISALLEFLRQTVSETKSWQGVDLTKPRIEGSWKFAGRGMISGDWSFWMHDPTKDEFTLSFIYDDGKRLLVIDCRRDDKARFRVAELRSDELTVLLL